MAGLLSWRVKRPLTSTELHFLCSSRKSPKRETLNWQQPPMAVLWPSSSSSSQCLPPSFWLVEFPPQHPLSVQSRAVLQCQRFDLFQRTYEETWCLLKLPSHVGTLPTNWQCVMWVGFLILGDAVVTGKHHLYCALLSGPLQCLHCLRCLRWGLWEVEGSFSGCRNEYPFS